MGGERVSEQPRTRDAKVKRDPRILKRFAAHVGDDAYPETCPRCGWPCTHLVRAYWNSPWNDHGGFCTICCQEAERRFDRDGWPPDPAEEIPEVPERTDQAEPVPLFGR